MEGQGLDYASANHGGLVRATESHHPCHLVFVKTAISSLVLRSEANKVELEVLAEDFEAPSYAGVGISHIKSEISNRAKKKACDRGGGESHRARRRQLR